MVYQVGIIGAGLQGKRRATAISTMQNANVVAVADINEETARTFSELFHCRHTTDWISVVSDPEIKVILVCTPPHLHEEIAISAIRQGKHVLCEKPLASSTDQAKRMMEEAKKNRVKLGCGFNLRHHPAIRQVHEWVTAGKIGNIISLRSRYGIGGREGYENDWRTNPEISGGGELMDQGPHLLDLAQWFLGKIDSVTGLLQTAYWPIAPVEDNAFIILKSEQDAIASLHVSWTQWKPIFSLEIHGTDGYAIAEGLGGAYGTEKAIFGKRDFNAPFQESVVEFRGNDQSWKLDLDNFFSEFNDPSKLPESAASGLNVMALIEALYKSHQERKTVKINHQELRI